MFGEKLSLCLFKGIDLDKMDPHHDSNIRLYRRHLPKSFRDALRSDKDAIYRYFSEDKASHMATIIRHIHGAVPTQSDYDFYETCILLIYVVVFILFDQYLI